LLTEGDIDKSLKPSLTTLFKLGIFDLNGLHPFAHLNSSDVHTPTHIKLAKEAALQSIVLLKNDNHLLPLKKSDIKSLMVIGPNASNLHVLMGNYNGLSGKMVSFVEGITEEAGPSISVQYELGSDYSDTARFGGVWAAGMADVTIACLGLTPAQEGEEHDAFLSKTGGDKVDLSIPLSHIKLLQQLRANKKPLILVLNAGSAIDIEALKPYADAILLTWYPGEQGGAALADILFGKRSPSGRLPVTFYKSLDDLPAYDNYSLQGRTYRYFKGEVSFPFGFGLSYTTFKYEWLQKPLTLYCGRDSIKLSMSVQNTGLVNADEVVQVYIEYPGNTNGLNRELKAFKRVSTLVGEKSIVQLSIAVKDLEKWSEETRAFELLKGEYNLCIGPDSKTDVLKTTFSIQ
jgi:beta-glucosidase